MKVIIPEGKLLYTPTIANSIDSSFITNINRPCKLQYFTIENFNANISAKALPDFELSLDKKTFKNPLPLPTHDSYATDTVWVRLVESNTAKKIPESELLITGDVDTISVDLPESIILGPVSLLTSSNFETFKTNKGTPSKSQQFKIKGENLISEVLIECDYGFEIRKTDNSWSNLNSIKYDYNTTIDDEFEIRINENDTNGTLGSFENSLFNNNHLISQPNTNHIIIKTQNIDDTYLALEYDIKNIITTFDTTLTEVINIGDKINIYPDTNNYTIDKVSLNFRAINNPNFQTKNIEKDIHGSYFFKVDSLPIGIEYFVITQYHYLNQDNYVFYDTSTTFYKYFPLQKYNHTPRLKKGNTVAAYQVLSFPFDVTNTSLSKYLETTLGATNHQKWRLFKFNSYANLYIEYSYINKIENGEAYMLISRDGGQLPSYTAKPLYVNQKQPYEIDLISGWNLIGNPYDFKVDWNDINIANIGNGITQFYTLVNGSFQDGTATGLEPFSGAFIYVNNAVKIKIPAVNKQSTQRSGAIKRLANQENKTKISSDFDWEINFTISQNQLVNNFVGVGMNQLAKPGYDKFDKVKMPRFIEYADFYTSRIENSPSLSKDVVTPSSCQTWDFVFETNNTKDAVTLQWDQPVALSNNIYILDESNLKIISMKNVNSYSFTPSAKKQTFKIVYGTETYLNQEIDFTISNITSIAPNPIKDITSINYFISKNETINNVNFYIKDVNGTNVKTIESLAHEGLNTQELDISDLQSGIYILEMKIGNTSDIKKIIKQ